MTWTRKHQDLAIKNRWWQSTTNLAEFICRQAKSDRAIEIEFDANKFQRHIAKLRGKPYHRTLIRKAMAQLDSNSNGLIVILRDYSHGIYKLLVRPISFLNENKDSQSENRVNQNAGNPMFSEEHKARVAQQQQQDINKIDRLLKKIGVIFDGDALNRIWGLSGKCINEVRKAIEHMLYRHSKGVKKIENPQGFLVDSLRDGWAKDFNIYYQPELPTFKSRLDISKYVSDALNETFSQKNGASDEIAPTPT